MPAQMQQLSTTSLPQFKVPKLVAAPTPPPVLALKSAPTKTASSLAVEPPKHDFFMSESKVLGERSASQRAAGVAKNDQKKVAALTKRPKRPNFFERAAMRKEKYAPIIARHAKEQGVPVQLALAIVEIESSFRVKARGAAGEVGLMQIRPRTARGMGYTGSTKALYDPETNVRFGMKYLAEARRRGGGSTCGTILKYNAGHYAKRMNPISARYCKRVKKVMAKNATRI